MSVNTGYLTLAPDEPTAVQEMQDVAAGMRGVPRLSIVLPRITATAAALTGAYFGNIQIVDPRDGALVLVNHRYDTGELAYSTVTSSPRNPAHW
ncbi:hypothetical protein ACGF3G_29590 [Streptomyces sp. NPDC048179]|uniref:hypothetical protein n=1 Tax=Streptomyces sp. NPDC048179 TaxID=3365506 RepID=UPI0037226F03